MKQTIGAGHIRKALREFFPSGAYAVVDEVRSCTGYGPNGERYADALVCSCWPSRGLWVAGVEIKVSRSDWKREIEQQQEAMRRAVELDARIAQLLVMLGEGAA